MTKTAENPTLYCSTYLYSLYKRVPSPPVVDKRVDVVLCGQTVSKMFEKNKMFTVFDEMFDVVHILSNTIQHDQIWCLKRKNVWSPNNDRSCLIAKYVFPVWTGLNNVKKTTRHA